MTDEHLKEIYVYLLDEPVDAWRPVQAVEQTDGLYRIVSINPHPDDEHWEFTTGDIVRVRKTRFSDERTELVAFERVDSSSWDS